MSAKAVATAFDELGLSYEIVSADLQLINTLSALKPARAFLAGHGKYAEDGTLQGICEYLKIPYTASGVLSSALCMDKCFFKDYISLHKIPTPPYQILNMKNQDPKKVKPHIPLPFVVKPSREGSTVGISVCKKENERLPALQKALKHDTKILVEAYIEGTEVAVSILKDKALTPVEIVPESGFYDYESKYRSSKTQYILPPRLNQAVIEQCKKIALQTARLARVGTYCRVDFLIKNNTTPLMTEINTLPGLTNHSLLPKSAEHDGISFNELILQILQDANLDYILRG